MSKVSSLSIAAAIALALSACSQTQTAAPVDQVAEAAKAQVAQQEANKKMITDMMGARRGGGGGAPPAGAAPAGGAAPPPGAGGYLAMVSPEYIQHNPQDVLFNEVNKVSAYDGFTLKQETMAKLRGGRGMGPPDAAPANGPQPPPGNQLYKVLADGDMVMMIHQRYRLVPGTKDKFIPEYTFDAMRIKDGKFVEHWDDNRLPDKLPEELLKPASELKYPPQQAQPAG